MKIPTTLPLATSAPLPSNTLPADTLSLRRRLLQVLNQEDVPNSPSKTSVVEKVLEPYLTAGKIPPSVLVDFAAVYQAAARHDGQTQAQQCEREMAAEEEQLEQVALLLPDIETVSAYMEEQLPFFEAHLQQVGIPEQQIKKRVQQFHKRVIKSVFQQTLIDGNWDAAERILTRFNRLFTDEEKNIAGMKICQLYARDKAAELWLQIAQTSLGQPQDIYRQAIAQLREPDEELADSIRSVLRQMCRRQETFLSAQRQALYEQLATASSEEAEKLLDAQQCLTPAQLADAQQAVAQLDETQKTDTKWFVENYLSADEKSVQKALYKKGCSARDYFRLAARAEALQINRTDDEVTLLVSAVTVWCAKKGLDSAPIAYYLLTRFGETQERWEGWKSIQQQLAV